MPATPSLLSQLGKSAAAAYNYARSQAASKVPASQALANYRATGGAIRTDTFLTLYRTLTNKADIPDYQKLVGENGILPLKAHTLAPVMFQGDAPFQYLVGTNSSNPLIPEAVYVNSFQALSTNQIFAKAASTFSYEEGSGMSPNDLSDVVFTVDDARYAPGSFADVESGGSAAI